MNTVDAVRSKSMSRSVGWFSLALGAAELALPKLVARGIGVDATGRSTFVMRLLGLREIATGINILIAPRRPWPRWARVAGDAMDLALLGLAVAKRTSTVKLASVIAAVGGVTAIDVIASLDAHKAQAKRPILDSVTINKPPSVVYAFYRELGRLPEVMDYLEEVFERDPRRSRWIARPIDGRTVAWEAEIVEDVPDQVIAWRSIAGSPIQTRGRVTFATAPGRESTEVRIEMELGPTSSGKNAALAKFFSRSQIRGELHRLKQLLETGEVLKPEAMAR